MNKIISSFLDTHIREYELQNEDKNKSFEHFVNRCIINKYLEERFDPSDIMTGKGERGIDGIAILVNDVLITNISDLREQLASERVNVKFIFIQSKMSEKFSGSEIGDFIYGVKSFFADENNRPNTNEHIETLISYKDEIYEKSINFESSPEVDMYYVCCGKWNDDNGLQNRIDCDLKELKNRAEFSKVTFYKYDADKIIMSYKEMKKKVKRSLQMEKKVAFPSIEGVNQAYIGIVKCKDFISLLIDGDGKLMTNIFEDNVRDFQGYNSVNEEIRNTLKNRIDQERFSILNNGITIVANKVKVTGDEIELYDYQIVNGCQSSYVLFDNKNLLTDKSYVVIKIIDVDNEEISDRVIFTTNRQTEVKPEAFIATSSFQKELQDTYNAYPEKYRLYYERRSKQYDLNDNISKNRVVSLTIQIKSYIAMFLNEPHSTHRYYGELLRAYNKKIFLDEDSREIYYVAAYYYYFVEKNLKINSKYNRRLKIYKYHIICAMRALMIGKKVISNKKREQRKEYEKLYEMIEDGKLERLMKLAIECLNECISNKPYLQDMDRRSEFTSLLLDKCLEKKELVEGNLYLKKGSVVQCYVVERVSNKKFNVEIRTDDSRKKGELYLEEKEINEVSIPRDQLFQATICSEKYSDKYGWRLEYHGDE